MSFDIFAGYSKGKLVSTDLNRLLTKEFKFLMYLLRYLPLTQDYKLVPSDPKTTMILNFLEVNNKDFLNFVKL